MFRSFFVLDLWIVKTDLTKLHVWSIEHRNSIELESVVTQLKEILGELQGVRR